MISHLTIKGTSYLGLLGRLDDAKISNLGLEGVDINGTGDWVGTLVGGNEGSITNCYSTGTVTGDYGVGGLMGGNIGSIANCWSTATVSGTNRYVGGLVGGNVGSIANCYSMGTVTGGCVGGLVGQNGYVTTWTGDALYGTVLNCYSVGMVIGNEPMVTGIEPAGGLVGLTPIDGFAFAFWPVGETIESFWYIQTSGQTNMCGGIEEFNTGCENSYGKTTGEMQTGGTFLDAGWDFIGETANGTDDIWWILEGQDYPRLWWEAAGQ